jgi:hypothetical protein
VYHNVVSSEQLDKPETSNLGVAVSLEPDVFKASVVGECLMHFIPALDLDPAYSQYNQTVAKMKLASEQKIRDASGLNAPSPLLVSTAAAARGDKHVADGSEQAGCGM